MKCSVPGCVNSRRTRLSTEHKFHFFPTEPVHCNRWVEAIQSPRFDPKFTTVLMTKTYKMCVCSDHFTEEDYHGGRKTFYATLKRHAVPSIFPWEPAVRSHREISQQRVQPMHPREMPPFLRLQLSSPVNRSHGPRQRASLPVVRLPGPSGLYYATNPAMDPARQQSLRFTVKQEEKDTQAEKDIQNLPSDKTHAVMIKKERDTEGSVCGNYGVTKEEQQEQPIATEIKVEPSDEEEQEGSAYPPLPAMPFPSLLNIEAASFNIPPRLSLQLLLVCKPPGLSVLWNVEETDPSPPPMESYSVYMAVEKDKGSGMLAEWKTLGVLKAAPLPMCVTISQVKPGFRACFAVVGKDTYGRYGPFSKIMPVIVPDQSDQNNLP